MRQRGAHAPVAGSYAGPAFNGLTQITRCASRDEPGHGGGEHVGVARSRPSEQTTTTPPRILPPRPRSEVLADRLADPRPALPVDDGLGSSAQRLVGVPAGERARDPGQACAEAEDLDAARAPRDRVRELEQRAG